MVNLGSSYKMYYLGQSSTDPGWHERVCVATSTDGKTWVKPKLGLVSVGGSTANNCVRFTNELTGDTPNRVAVTVIYDNTEPDASRKFKMIYETHGVKGSDAKIWVAFSADGITFADQPIEPPTVTMEPSALTASHSDNKSTRLIVRDEEPAAPPLWMR